MADAQWMVEDRLGLFVHFGLYSEAARHEWVMTYEKMTTLQYERYAKYFDPDLYDPREWARAAKAAGMRYVVLTTKHHDGFCLWNSAQTDYTVMNTPFGSDIVASFVEAFRAEGIRIGLYYSMLDWHHPDFTIDSLHPRSEEPNVDELNAGRDMERYRRYVRAQLRELLTGYGPIDYMFFDYSYTPETSPEVWGHKGREEWGSAEIVELVRELQPNALINDRLDVPGDVVTPEQYQPEDGMTSDGHDVLWEACQTLNGSWGYYRDNQAFKTPDLVARMLIDGVSKGGNLLFNVGPTARGVIDDASARLLRELGEWMRFHSRSIYGAGRSTFAPPRDARYTQRGDRLYLHLFAWPFGQVHLAGLADRVEYARFLHDASEVPFEVIPEDAIAMNTKMGGLPSGTLTLALPVRRPDVLVPVVELFLRTIEE